MPVIWRMALYGVIGVLGFDTLASFASRSFGFPYGYATVGSCLIYAILGIVVGRMATVATAAGTAFLVGVGEATVGWWISWQIGPGRPPVGKLTIGSVVLTILFVSVMSASIGAAAGALGRAVARRAGS